MSRFMSSAYGPPWEGIQGTGVTATGIDLRPARQIYIVAVDPKVIPLHTPLAIWPNPFGLRVTFKAEDTGSAIKGNRIDFYDWRGRSHQNGWGMKWVDVTFLGKSTPPSRPAPTTPHSTPYPTMPGTEGNPANGKSTAYDYSAILRSNGRNVRRHGAFLRDAGDAILRLRH